MTKVGNKFLSYAFEAAKWGIVVWLLWPLLSFQGAKMPLWRMMAGVMLIVIYLGKTFYDIIINNFKQRKESYTVLDLLRLAGAIAIIAVIIGGAVVLIGFYVMTQYQQGTDPAQ